MGNIVIMNGKELSEKLLVKQKLKLKKDERPPHALVITVGNDEASSIYVRNKKLACEKCNIDFTHLSFDENISREDLKSIIEKYNTDKNIDGILIQQPVPSHLQGLEQHIVPSKDIDGFSTFNLGGTLNNDSSHIPACTPSGIMDVLNEYNISLDGKHVVVIGRSNIVGKPLIGMLLSKNATVTSCNSHTKDLQSITKMADILIVAIGRGKYINSSFISDKCECIIDVGINRDENGKLCGDVDFENVVSFFNSLKGDRYITPVPCGIGPMTVYSLIKNINNAYKNNKNN